jgi:hypothetical protein
MSAGAPHALERAAACLEARWARRARSLGAMRRGLGAWAAEVVAAEARLVEAEHASHEARGQLEAAGAAWRYPLALDWHARSVLELARAEERSRSAVERRERAEREFHALKLELSGERLRIQMISEAGRRLAWRARRREEERRT